MISKDFPGFNFTREEIAGNVPADSGVYALFNSDAWIYVGEAANLRVKLLEHLAGDNPCINSHEPTGFQFELWPADRRSTRRGQLIIQMVPLCNARG